MSAEALSLRLLCLVESPQVLVLACDFGELVGVAYIEHQALRELNADTCCVSHRWEQLAEAYSCVLALYSKVIL